MEVHIFNRVFSLGVFPADGHGKRQSQTTIINLPNTTPKASLLKANERNLRKFSRMAIPHRAISLIRDGVLAQNWRVVPTKVGAKVPNVYVKAIENIILHPNETDSYRTFWGQVLSEALVGDNGAAEIVFTGDKKQPMKLYSVNGFALEHVKGFFTDPEFYRFVQITEGAKRIYLYDKDVIYLQHTKTADSPFGLSPLEAAFKELISLFDAQEYAKTQASNAVPKNALNLGEGVSSQDLLAYRKYFVEEVYGKGIMPILGGQKGASSLKLGAEGDSELYLEWQKFLITIVALAFNIDPKKLGQGSNTDRSTVQEQNEALLNEAIRPYCLLLQDEINKKIIGRLGLSDVIKFEFYFEDTLAQRQQKQTMLTEQWNNNGITLNEYRVALGLPESNSEYKDMTQAEMKSALNKKYAVQTGGFNGLGKDQKEGVQKKTDGEKKASS